MMELNNLTAISPVDGRYNKATAPLQPIFSEYGLIHNRVIVEITWLINLANSPQLSDIPTLSKAGLATLRQLITDFDITAAQRVKAIETTTNHDVKAIEYWLKESVADQSELTELSEFIHFACTSEDINNLSYALMLKQGRMVVIQQYQQVISQLRQFAHELSNAPMMCRTHGQPATPSTMGKEFANVVHRLERQLEQMSQISILGKLNGAVGNFNAHMTAYPDTDWEAIAQNTIQELGLDYNPYTTQIEPHDYIAELCHNMQRTNTILVDLCRDMWSYISINYFKQKVIATEVGSSTMPHKVNPIDFENCEGNLGLANALLSHFADKLPISRWQRDLSDSTVLRNLGSAFGYTLIALSALQRGLNKVECNQQGMLEELSDNWEVLAEPIQTVMRRYNIEKPYEKLKALTRGKKITQQDMSRFIDTLDLPDDVKYQLKALTPSTYLGNAKKKAQSI